MHHARAALSTVLTAAALALAGCGYLGSLSGMIDAFASFLPLTIPLALAALAAAVRGSRAAIAAGAILAVLLCLGRLVPEWAAPLPPPRSGGHITIETHNLRGGGVAPDAQWRALAASGADVLLLQEARRDAPAMLRRLAAIYPYRDNCGNCDLAILSRLPMSHVEWRLPDRTGGRAGPALFRAQVAVPGAGTVTVLTVHAPWPIPPAAQARFRATLIDAIRQNDGNRFILTGDFNLTPWGAGMRQLDAGLAPMRRITRGRFTFPVLIGNQPWPLPLLPLDQIFVGPQIGVESIRTMPSTGSDHLPIQARLTIDAP